MGNSGLLARSSDPLSTAFGVPLSTPPRVFPRAPFIRRNLVINF